MARRKSTAATDATRYPIVIESYSDPSWHINASPNPSCFNGAVQIDRYRITIERIDEPLEVLRDRLRKLWRDSEHNHHSWAPMQRRARELGINLDVNEQGANFVRRGAKVQP